MTTTFQSNETALVAFQIVGATYWQGVVSSSTPRISTTRVGNGVVTLESGGNVTMSLSNGTETVAFTGSVADNGTMHSFSSFEIAHATLSSLGWHGPNNPYNEPNLGTKAGKSHHN